MDSILDVTITQEGFKIVVEMKLTDWFYFDQLMRYLKSFGDEKNKVMITLDSELMSEEKLVDFKNQLKEYNATQTYPVIHINIIFEMIVNAIREVIDNRDYGMQNVLEDYLDYCYKDGLIPGSTYVFSLQESQLILILAITFITIKLNVGLERMIILDYINRSIHAIGKNYARITAIETESGIKYTSEFGELTDERKALIQKAMDDGDSHVYGLRMIEHRYFFVENFYETDF